MLVSALLLHPLYKVEYKASKDPLFSFFKKNQLILTPQNGGNTKLQRLLRTVTFDPSKHFHNPCETCV